MKKIIFTQEWMAMHPYNKVEDTDLYYTNLANKIYHALDTTCFVHQFKDTQDAKLLALCITSYFEDVISGTCIWKAFSTECMKRYGTYIPFYLSDAAINNSRSLMKNAEILPYDQDFINLADIKFLLWHHYQQSCLVQETVPPIFGPLEIAAVMIYNLLDAEYETAPENERLYEWLCTSPTDADSFYEYRNKLEWFHYGCYFNCGNQRRLFMTLQWLANTGNYNELNAYTARVEQTMNSRDNLLALSSAEWLAKVSEMHPEHKLWTDVDFKSTRFYIVKKADENFIYAKDTTDDSTVKVNKLSLNEEAITVADKKDSVFSATMFKYGDSWWLNGAMRGFENNKETKKLIREGKELFNHKVAIDDYNLLKENGFGARFVFADNMSDVREFLKQIGYDKELPQMPSHNNEIIIYGSPYTGLNITTGIAHCICSPDNPFYNQERAAEHCFDIISGNGHPFPYEIVCMLIAGGMLPDANAFASKYVKDFGSIITQENLQFFADYYLKGRRDKDLSPQELW